MYGWYGLVIPIYMVESCCVNFKAKSLIFLSRRDKIFPKSFFVTLFLQPTNIITEEHSMSCVRFVGTKQLHVVSGSKWILCFLGSVPQKATIKGCFRWQLEASHTFSRNNSVDMLLRLSFKLSSIQVFPQLRGTNQRIISSVYISIPYAPHTGASKINIQIVPTRIFHTQTSYTYLISPNDCITNKVYYYLTGYGQHTFT